MKSSSCILLAFYIVGLKTGTAMASWSSDAPFLAAGQSYDTEGSVSGSSICVGGRQCGRISCMEASMEQDPAMPAGVQPGTTVEKFLLIIL